MTKNIILAITFLAAGSAFAQQIPGKFIADQAVTAAKIGSEAATLGKVLTANGSGAATWETAAAGGTYFQEAPSGSGTAFTLAHTPTSNATVHLFVNGLFLRQGTDYTISGTGITLSVSLEPGQTIDAAYIY